MTFDSAALHPEIAAVGAALGGLSLLVDRRRSGIAADVASLAVAGYLALIGQVPTLLPLLVGVVVVAGRLPPRPRLALLALAGVGLVLVRPDLATGGRVLLAVGLTGVLALGSIPRPDRHHLLLWALVSTCFGATFLGGPDTEAAIAAGAALGLALLARREPGMPLPLAAMALAAWVAVDAYRGRPAGLPAAIVAITAVAMVGLLGPLDRRSVGLVAVTAITAAIAARTVGADVASSATALLAASATAAVLLGAAALVGRVSDPTGPARTPAA